MLMMNLVSVFYEQLLLRVIVDEYEVFCYYEYDEVEGEWDSAGVFSRRGAVLVFCYLVHDRICFQPRRLLCGLLFLGLFWLC